MNMDYYPSDELIALLVGMTEGELSRDQRARFNELIVADADARSFYVEYMSTHAMLELQHGGAPVVEVSFGEPSQLSLSSPPTSYGSLLFGLAVAASLLVAVVFGIQKFGRINAPVVATLFHGDRIKYQDGSLSNVDGSLHVGPASLSDGVRKFTLNSGVRIALEGPATFAFLEDHNRFQLDEGRLRAHVPPEAQGFTVQIPRNTIVDLGTEFGVDVDADGSVEIHVFKGAIKFGDAFNLKAGKSKRINKQGEEVESQIEGKKFPALEPR